MTVKVILTVILLLNAAYVYPQPEKPKLSITIDDPAADTSDVYTWQQINDALLKTFHKYDLKAALFVCGKRINSDEGFKLIKQWDEKGHMICNHSYSHNYFHSKKITNEIFENDFLRCDSLINIYSNYTKLFRYSYLKEGNTIEKRDGFRSFLNNLGYRNGYVTIDASDWYIDSRMTDTLRFDKNFDITPFKQYYIKHIYERALFYDSLAFELTGRNIKHTLLLHCNLINAMFLGELIEYFISNGWEIINAADSFDDVIYSMQPDILPAGESIVWALAKESGRYENVLRYPAEDGVYEAETLNAYINSYNSK